ncbi:Phosphotransferase enzyme [Ophidiomyces ophidiicola]|nr:Phosphotransferase enzyme [Ophidiomyces ophidiicola]
MITLQVSIRVLSRKYYLYSIPPFLSRRLSSATSQAAPSSESHEDFFRYTTGRWLWNEEEQLRQRYRRFNVCELQKVAAQALGRSLSFASSTRHCVEMKKIAEGNYYKVFRLQMDDGRAVMARIPHPNVRPVMYAMASEVAMVDFARSVLGIPVPKVLEWKASLHGNPVEAEYIIMEEAEGTLLSDGWHTMKPAERESIIDGIVEVQQKLVSVAFNLSGSLYFANSGFQGCSAAEIIAGGSPSVREIVKDRFVIGPTVDVSYWEKERASMPIDRGPWKSAEDYAKVIAYREISWITRHAKDNPLDPHYTYEEAQTSPEAHIELLERYLSVIGMLIPKQTDFTRSTLWHSGFNHDNVFVNNGKISSMVDWHRGGILPLILQADIPPLLNQDEKDKVLKQISSSTRQEYYRMQTALENPLVARVLEIPQLQMIQYLTTLASDSWTHESGILKLREVLLKVMRRWDQFNLKTSCPYHFSDTDIEQHLKAGENFNASQDFWESLDGIVGRDGFTWHDYFDAAVDLFAEFRKMGLKDLSGKDREEFDYWTHWVIDRQREREEKREEEARKK